MKSLRDFLGMEPNDLHVRGFCSMGGGGGGSTNTIQKSDPWSGQAPFLTGGDNGTPGIYTSAATLYNGMGGTNGTGAEPQYYPGETYAGLTDQQKGLMSALIGAGQQGTSAIQGAQSNLSSTLGQGYTSGTSGAFNQGQGVLSNILDPSYLNPWNSSSFDTVVNNTLARAIPAATSSFTNGNRSDSGLATRAATMAATDSVGQLAQNQYQTNQALQTAAEKQASDNFLTQQGNQLKGVGLAPLIDQTQLGDLGTALQTAGATQTDLQNQIQAAMSRYNYNQMLPWNQLGLYENAITGAGNPGGTTSTSQPYFSNPMANIIGGVGALGSSALIASQLGLFGGGGAAAAGGLTAGEAAMMALAGAAAA